MIETELGEWHWWCRKCGGIGHRVCPLFEERMTLKEAVALLGTTPDNLRGAIRRGSLKAAKHGRDWWVDPSEVERYRLEHRRGTDR